jgi:hypothetical protein
MKVVTRGRAKLGTAGFTGVASTAATIDPGSLLDGAGETDTVAVTGVQLGDCVLVGPGVDLAGITVTGWVSSPGTVSVRVQNESGGTLNLAGSTWNFIVLRRAF